MSFNFDINIYWAKYCACNIGFNQLLMHFRNEVHFLQYLYWFQKPYFKSGWEQARSQLGLGSLWFSIVVRA